MTKWLSAFLFVLLFAGSLFAQDMPPLPPMPDQGQATTPSNNPPPLPSSTQPSTTTNQNPALPPLPGQSQGSTVVTPSTNPPAPDNNQSQTMPPLPGDQTATAPTTTAAPEQAAATPTPEMGTAPVAETKPVPKHAAKKKPWQVSKYRPNVIFGGWVTAKGGNENSRLAWTSQEVLNALLFKKYKLISPREGKPEEGTYAGQGGHQWREFSFNVPKSKLAVQVYVRQDGNKKIWLRVGPDEAVAPAATSLAKAKKMRLADLTVLHLLQKKFGRRLAPHQTIASWDAPYRYAQETADE